MALQGAANLAGITDLGSDRLLVGNKLLPNQSISTFGSLFSGTTPQREYLYHFRWGHRAAKIVPSAVGAERYYVSLATTDENWESSFGGEHVFEVYQPLASAPYQGPQSMAEASLMTATADTVTANGVTSASTNFVTAGVLPVSYTHLTLPTKRIV